MVSGGKRIVWRIISAVVIVSLAVPVISISFEIIASGQDSVVVFEDTNPVISLLILSYYVLLIAALLIAGMAWSVKQVRQMIDLKNEQKKTELLHLQSQISPHFFFNILNNLYGLVDKDSARAKEMILRLSEMMRYSIYDSRNGLVALSEEVEFLKNYIDLHKNRYHKKVDVSFAISVEDDRLKVLPLLFIILVENAFKHGVENLTTGAYVHIKLVVEGNALSFEIENNFDPEGVTLRNGIGLSNLKKRLAIVYPHEHTLMFEQTNATYRVQMKLRSL